MNVEMKNLRFLTYISPVLMLLNNRWVFPLGLIFLVILTIFSGKDRFKSFFPGRSGPSPLLNVQLMIILLYILVFSGILPDYILFSSVIALISLEMPLRSGMNSERIIWYIPIITGSMLLYSVVYSGNIQERVVDYILYLSIIGGVTATLIESIESRENKAITVLLGLAMITWLFDEFGSRAGRVELISAFMISLSLGVLAYRAGVANETGLLSATLVGVIMIIFGGIRHFLLLLTFYVVGSVFTKYKYELKKERGIAEPEGGARGYSNVLGNSVAPLIFTVLWGAFNHLSFLAGFVASTATAAGDTLASEIGETSSRYPRMITNFKKVRPGTSGGVTLLGEISAMGGCLMIAVLGALMGMYDLRGAIIVAVAGFSGVHIDSLLGATIERKGWIDNSTVNFIATFAGGVVAVLITVYSKYYLF